MSKTFMPPKGYVPPEGIKEGEDFSELCTFKMCKGGLCMTKIGDVPMGDDKGGSKPDYGDYVNSMAATPTQN